MHHIKSWLGPFAKRLDPIAFQILTLLTHVSGVWRMIGKCQVCAFMLKIKDVAMNAEPRNVIVLVPYLVKRGKCFETPGSLVKSNTMSINKVSACD